MMTKTVAVLLIVCTLLVTDTTAWRRRSWRRVGRFVASGVKSYVAGKAVGAAVAAVGKREAMCAEQLTDDQLQQLATELQNACSEIGVNLAADGFDLDEVKDVFMASDVDGDGILLGGELTDFSAAIQTTEACSEAEAGPSE